MGLVVPEDFRLRGLPNDEERAVVEALRDRLSDDWLVFPDVALVADRRDHQIDVVLAHPREGIAVIEVKGHRVQIRHGQFVPDRGYLPVQPHVQARSNAYALRDRLREAAMELSEVKVEYGVVFSNTTDRRGDLPPELKPEQFMTAAFLDDPADAIDRLMCLRWRQELGTDGVATVARVLRPNCELDWDEGARVRRARQRMDELCEQRVRALEPLDANRRVLVTGGAGSGKTRLASAWARRAAGRGERVLLTCYNDPLGDVLVERLPPNNLLTVGSFYTVARALDGMPPLAVPDDADGTWWDTVAVGHLHSHWPTVTEHFDTVIVDEAQDFSPAWLAQLDQLIDPRGPRRLLLLADTAQGVYTRGFDPDTLDESWTRCELPDNCRNTFGIASILHRHLDGAMPVAGPESLDVRWREAADHATAIELVGEEIDHIEEEGYETPRVLVATTHRAVRDQLRQAMGLGAWEQRSEHSIVCETVHRVKGLEFDVVVLVADDDITDLLLYVGLSRALLGCSLVAPASVAARLGLT